MAQIIEKIRFNWRVASDGAQTADIYETHILGKNGVIKIEEHPAIGHGDAWFYDVHFESGAMERIFNPNHIFYSK